jgi:TPR repeat protein
LQGHADAEFKYAYCLDFGLGIGPDPVAASHYYKESADGGNSATQFAYGLLFRHKSDLSESVRYLKMAADQGNDRAQFAYALCLDGGSGVAQDPSGAARYYKQAADAGEVHAQMNFGRCCERGFGVRRNVSAAQHYFRLAAEQGCAAAQLKVGIALEVENPERAFDFSKWQRIKETAALRHVPAPAS